MTLKDLQKAHNHNLKQARQVIDIITEMTDKGQATMAGVISVQLMGQSLTTNEILLSMLEELHNYHEQMEVVEVNIDDIKKQKKTSTKEDK